MATILLSAAGAAIGGGIGGTVLGLTGAVIGRAVGASIGGLIDQKMFGQAAPLVETGRVESFRVQSAQEGTVISRVMGRMRIGGHMIWSSRFKENLTTSTSGGGKGGGSPEVTTNSYSYSVSLAFALGEGEIERVGRVWADGSEVPANDLNVTVYRGTAQQMPDPVIAAVEGLENTPAFRGTAYVVIEDLPLEQFGNRIPQLNFEVFRKAQPKGYAVDDPSTAIRSVCLIPGTGEYALATTPVEYPFGFGASNSANVNTNRGQANVVHALDDLDADLPNCDATSLVVTWFGTDLRCGLCKLRPQIEQKVYDGSPMPWVVSGLPRAGAIEGSRKDGRPVFGGTPADAAVIEGIAALKQREKEITFYPFILMDIQTENELIDPYTGVADQSEIPWRGRITTGLAPNVVGSSDGTLAARSEVDQFFGGASVSDFVVSGQTVAYTGVAEWSYRRFILHYAHLCALDGWCAWVIDEAVALRFVAGVWDYVHLLDDPNKASAKLLALEFDHSITAGATNVTSVVIPHHSSVVGITARVIDEIAFTGATTFKVGVAGADDRYGTGYGHWKNTYVQGLTGQLQTYWSDTAVLLSAEGGDFISGVIRIAIHATVLTPPAAV